MSNGARCPICTCQFARGNIGALRCGHTYHLPCIQQWLKTSKTCPNCRKKTTDRDVIERLYFDYEDGDTSICDQSFSVQAGKIEDLQLEVRKKTEEVVELQHKEQKLKTEHLEKEKELRKMQDLMKNREQRITTLKDTLRYLETTAGDHAADQAKIQELQDALKASDFYRAIVAKKGEDAVMQEYRKYVKNGNIETEQFLKILRSQVDKYKQRSSDLQKEVKDRDKQIRSMEDKQRDLQNLVKSLTEELKETRASCNKNTPYNPKLKTILDRSPVKRISMGFDESIRINTDVFDSAIRKPPAKKVLQQNMTVANQSVDVKPINLDDFCELVEANAIPTLETEPEAPKIVDKGDGIIVPQSVYDACNEPETKPYISPVKRAHIRMEAENEDRQLNPPAPKQQRLAGRPKTTRSKVNPAESRNRLSQFFARTDSSRSQSSSEVIQID